MSKIGVRTNLSWIQLRTYLSACKLSQVQVVKGNHMNRIVKRGEERIQGNHMNRIVKSIRLNRSKKKGRKIITSQAQGENTQTFSEAMFMDRLDLHPTKMC